MDAPRGYVSLQAKKAFTLSVGITAVVFFIIQLVVPLVIMFFTMFGMMFGDGMAFEGGDMGAAVKWKGDIWYPGVRVGLSTRGGERHWLMRLPSEPGAEPVPEGDLDQQVVGLVPDADRLWVFTEEEVLVYEESSLRSVHEEALAFATRPFLLDGNPSAIEYTEHGARLRTFIEGGWNEGTDFAIPAESQGHRHHYSDRLTALGREGGLDFFIRVDDFLYHLAGIPPKSEDPPSAQDVVCRVSGRWRAVDLSGTLTVFHIPATEDFIQRLEGYRRGANGWEKFLDEEMSLTSMFGVVPGESPDRFQLVFEGFPGNSRIMGYENGALTVTRRFGPGFPFGGSMMAMMTIPQIISGVAPLLMAWFISRSMRRYRVTDYAAEGRKIPYASLNRRAWAQLIDGAIFCLPLAFVVPLWMSMFIDGPDPRKMLPLMLAIPASGCWCILMLLVFSLTEGRSGRTPGKWITGIRVIGLDLKPCGFGRAFVRNLLKIVDSFFNFMVGIIICAMTEKWQRLGDLAARTVVIRAQPDQDF